MPDFFADYLSAEPYLLAISVAALLMLIWDTVEVGRNDAANLVNAAIGARVLTPRAAVYLAGLGVIFGAGASSGVIDTARNGIFDPTLFNSIETILSIYIAVYIVDTVLLYGYSAFGMPVSTTACLVFELLGASFALGGYKVVNWGTAGTVIFAIVCSIAMTGIAAFFIQRMVRGAIREKTNNLGALLAHGGWIGGGMLAALTYFMLVKGMRQVEFVKYVNREIIQAYGPVLCIFVLWAAFAIAIHALLIIFGRRIARRLFPTLAILGTCSMAFAFGQNDLANCAAPGLAALHLIKHRAEGIVNATQIPIAIWALLGCGILMALGMTTRNAQRVTSAAVHAGSMAHQVNLWAPNWCIALARALLRFRGHQPVLAPPPTVTSSGETTHYDVLRACVILTVGACVIATASDFKLPVSTTYVAFAAVVATGAADRIFQRGDAELKLARTIWVIFSWFAAAAIAAICAGGIAWLLNSAGLYGLIVAIGANLCVRRFLKKRADWQEQRVLEATRERFHPEYYAEEDEDV